MARQRESRQIGSQDDAGPITEPRSEESRAAVLLGASASASPLSPSLSPPLGPPAPETEYASQEQATRSGWFARTWQHLFAMHVIEGPDEIVEYRVGSQTIAVTTADGRGFCLAKERL